MARPARKTNTTARGLGWAHQQRVATLLRKHHDGTPCWWCELPMHRDKHRNWDHKTLAGDHTTPRAHGGQHADRLLHGTCNSQRGDGRWDHERPAALNTHPNQWTRSAAATAAHTDPTSLAMDW